MFDSDDDDQLLIDLSPAPEPDEREVGAWATDRGVFVSSVMAGMQEERAAAVRGIEAVGARPVWFEAFGGMDDDPEDAYLGSVASSDVYVGILGARYGRPLKSGYSATHSEYIEAVRRGLKVSLWNAQAQLDGRQRDFLEEVRVFHTTGSYSSPYDLAAGVERRLRTIAAEELCPWVKVGNCIVRSSGVSDDGRSITVQARVRDNTIASALEGRRPTNNYGRDSRTRITWPGRTTPVRIESVTSATTSSRARHFTIVAERGDAPSSRHDVSLSDRSPDDLAELAMRVALLGEANPLGSMSFMAEASNPLPALAGRGLSEDSLASVAELLVTEELVGSGRADHLTQFWLGPQTRAGRRLRLGWMPPRRYINDAPVERLIEGQMEIPSP